MPKFKDTKTGCTVRYGKPEMAYHITISTDKEEISGTYYTEIEMMDIHGADDFTSPLEEIELPEGVQEDIEENVGTLNDYFSALITKRLMKRKK